ncbi:MAG: FMN-binding protein [Victivallaceae bacterium]|nr:FMN-binding protein [Victivallaceae bacterium]
MKFLKETNNTIVLGLFLGVIGAIAALILAYVAQLTAEPIRKAKEAEINNALQEVLPKFDNSPVKNSFVLKADDNSGYEVTFYGAIKDGKLVGIAGKAKTMKGYSGKIVAMIGLTPAGKIRTVSVLKEQDKAAKPISAILVTQQSETPGLGTVLCQRKNIVTLASLFSNKKTVKTALPPNKYLDQFAGKTASTASCQAGKDGKVVYKTGATVTNKAAPWKVIKDGGTIIYKTGATVTSRAITDVVYRITHTYMVNKKEIDKKLETEN